MSNLYTVLPGLTPTQQEVAEAELLANQILGARFPDLDLREGTGLRDMVIRPGATLMALLRKGNDLYFAQNTVDKTDDQTDLEIVNSLMSNWFITRNAGSRAIISARLYFARSKSTAITSSVFFSPDNTLKFFPIESLTFSKETMSYDSFSNEYYLDVDLIAESEGEEYNLGEGSLLYFSNFDPYFLRAEINYLRDSSVASETNTQLISRTQSAISTRNLINDPSVDSNLRINFNYLTKILTVGMGDPEMLRDKIRALLDDEEPRFPTAVTFVGNLVRITLPDHGYHSGQVVKLTEATPSVHNGEFSITVVDADNFTYTPSTTVTIYDFPHVAAVNQPIFLNYGGMVDVYCGDTRANTVVQVTTDDTGRAEIGGAIYYATRSTITGGPDEDGIPYQENIPYQAIAMDKPNRKANVTAANHGLRTTTKVIATQMRQTMPITSATSNGTLVTVTVTTGYNTASLGATVVIEGVSPVAYNGQFNVTVTSNTTFTYNALSAPGVSGTITSASKISNPNLNGIYPVIPLFQESLLPGIIIDDATMDLTTGDIIITPGTDPLDGAGNGGNAGFLDPNAFSFIVPGLWTIGDIDNSITLLGYVIDYNLRNKFLTYRSPGTITCTNRTVLVTMLKHGLLVGNHIKIDGSLRTEYNGVWRIETVPNPDQFTFTSPTVIPESALGPVMIASVTARQDYGHSDRSAMIADFGTKYANTTVSFETNYFQYLEGVQTYLDSSSNRVLCGDLLARGFNLYILDVSLVAYNGTAPSTGAVATSFNKYLASLDPGAVFVLADAAGQLNADGITSFQTPIGILAHRYTRELFPLPSATITDYLDPDDRTNIFLLGTVTTTSENV